jgi:hypothetical protein
MSPGSTLRGLYQDESGNSIVSYRPEEATLYNQDGANEAVTITNASNGAVLGYGRVGEGGSDANLNAAAFAAAIIPSGQSFNVTYNNSQGEPCQLNEVY